MEQAETSVQQKRNKKLRWFIGVGLAILLIVGSLTVYAHNSGPKVTMPAAIASRLHFPAYLPERLPGNYSIDEHTFRYSEGVLIFRVTNNAGGNIVFSEQLRPSNLDFDDFYKTQMTEAKSLEDVPFPSVVGKMGATDSLVLSVVTKDTWLLANTNSPLDESAMQTIAQSLKEHR